VVRPWSAARTGTCTPTRQGQGSTSLFARIVPVYPYTLAASFAPALHHLLYCANSQVEPC
jgi:hypothetical protein